jgi:signal transduction histidine kinase
MSTSKNRRILVIDDNAAIHQDFDKILLPKDDKAAALGDLRAAFLGGGESSAPKQQDAAAIEFELTHALQGQEGYQLLCQACDAGEPFALAFVDMRMPPGWDGVQTIAKLWERDPDLQVVVCTAFSDYTWEETVAELGQSDRLLVLKKPFDAIEILQLATALSEKWNTTLHERSLLEEVRRAELEARAYAASLETVNRTLVTARAAAEMAAELKNEFLVRLSSEVSCRLTEVLENVELLLAPSALESQQPIESVLSVGQHLLETITELLEVTTLESGKAGLELSSCDPRELARRVLDQQRLIAGQKGVDLRLRCDPVVPAAIETDEHHLTKLLEILVDNAIRCTEEGSVSVELSLTSTDSWKRPRLVIEVTDTGCGIPREKLGVIFEPSARADSERGGYGFGLTIAKRLSGLLGGDLVVRSEVGQGTTFCLDLGAKSPSLNQAA